MKVLIGCEFSQVVTKTFRNKGHEAYSCDLMPTEGNPDWHIQDDVLKIVEDNCWDLAIFHPPCTFLCVTGNKWMKSEYRHRFPNREQDREDAVEFFLALANAPIHKIAIENPVGIMSTRWRKPDQYIHPYFFGDCHSKKTGMWLKNLPKLEPTNTVIPEMYTYADGRKDPMWHMKTLKLPAEERARARNRTFVGIADAMANQWGTLETKQ